MGREHLGRGAWESWFLVLGVDWIHKVRVVHGGWRRYSSGYPT